MNDDHNTHKSIQHSHIVEHHHHGHANDSKHTSGYHLLQIEELSIGFRMYDQSLVTHPRPKVALRASTLADASELARSMPNLPKNPTRCERISSLLHNSALNTTLGRGRVTRHYSPKRASFFSARKKDVLMIKNLHMSVHSAEIVALVGASGSGKTLLADALMGIYEPNATVAGSIWFDGELQSAASLAELRGRGISLVPQSIAHLDPLMKVGKQLLATARGRKQNKQRAGRITELLKRYSLEESVLSKYPFELSGGMARRVLLLMALLDEPKLLIADEPTPGLDLDLARKAMEDFRIFANEGGGVLLITHDIELALEVADRVAVFKEGTIVEETAVASFASPHTLKHPFSKQLWHALPEHDFAVVEPNGAEQGGTEKSGEWAWQQ